MTRNKLALIAAVIVGAGVIAGRIVSAQEPAPLAEALVEAQEPATPEAGDLAFSLFVRSWEFTPKVSAGRIWRATA